MDVNHSFRLYRYRQPLAPSLQLAGQLHDVREGLLLRRETPQGVRWAEAAPLPGFSRERLDEVIAAAQRRDWTRHASLQFAASSLLYHPATSEGQGAPRATTCSLPTNGLLLGEWNALRQERDRLLELPYPALKFKVGRPGLWAEEARFVDALRSCMRPGQSLRLDANRRWTRDEAIQFCHAIGADSIEYLEEPTQDSKEFEEISGETGIPYALDETLLEQPSKKDFPNCTALVIKPTLLGDDFASYPAWNLPMTFSAAFESGVGLWQIARLARRFSPQIPCGLDTHRWFHNGPGVEGISFAPGRCYTAPDVSPQTMQLEEIEG